MTRTNIFKVTTTTAVIFLLLYACQKGFTGLVQSQPILMASSTNVATGQTVSLSVINAPAGTHNVWSSTPQASTLLIVTGTVGVANVSFSKAGTYTITCGFASGAGADSVSYSDTTVTPHDTVVYYPPPPQDSTGYPHDTLPNPADTVPSNPHDTGVYNPPPPQDSTHYPVDTTRYPVDSTSHSNASHPVVSHVTIVIVVH